jgi:hypothetical protein
MTTLFWTYEGTFAQPHKNLQDAATWLELYEVDRVVEILHRDDMSVDFAWDRTKQAENINTMSAAISEAFKAARDCKPKSEQERQIIAQLCAKMEAAVAK